MRRLGSREYGTEPSESGTETSLLEAIETHAIFTLDTEGRITRWSAPAASLYGRDAGSVLGRHLRTLFADGDHDETDSPAATLLSAAGEGPTEAEHWHERGDGSVFWGTLALSPRQEEVSGGYVAVCQDTTIDKEYERMLERQNDRLKEFTDILAHDLRNPLNVIEAHVTLYEETGDDEHIETIDETTERLARLVESHG